jgi:hypothetical protein
MAKKPKYDDKEEAGYTSFKEQIENITDVNVMLEAAQSAEKDQREIAREAQIFITKRDGQWEPFWWQNSSNKPRYTFDMTSPIVDQIMGEVESASFDIRVSPGGGDATKDIALLYDGIIRNIENMSEARHIYTMSARNMVITGFDAWRVVQKYAEADSFDQDLMIEPIYNAIDRVWFDASSQAQDKSDARWCIVLHAVGTDEYFAKWPEGSGQSVSDGREINAYYDKADVIIVGELLYYKERPRTLVQMSNGAVYTDDDKFQMVKDELAVLGVTELKRREKKEKVVCSRFFDASDFLDESKETVFDRFPVVPLFGNFKVFENKTLYQGAVEKLIDSQRVLNYSLSREIEEGALAPRAKYWMTKAQASGHEKQLATLNTNSDPVQFFNFDQAFPQVPMQQGGAQINPGLRTISEAMRQIIGQTAGMFAANMGDNPGLQSGVAIQSLQNKGDNGTIKYFKALEFAIAYTGKILVKAIPKVYDTERQVRLMYEDGTYEMGTLNQQVIDNQTGRLITMNDLSQGQYDVVCKAGPSFRNRQEETINALLEIAKVDPSILQVGGDLLLKNISTPVADQLAERKRAMMLAQGLIPEYQMTDEEKQAQAQKAQGQQAQDPNMVLAQAEMMKGQAEMLNAQNKQTELQLEMLKIQAQTEKNQTEAAINTFKAQTDRFQAETMAQERGAKVQITGIEATGKQLDNIRKTQELTIPVGLLQEPKPKRRRYNPKTDRVE